jgi:TatD DNase family protein
LLASEKTLRHTTGMQYIDTHCHIHDSECFDEAAAEQAYQDAVKSGVVWMICIATSLADSKQAIDFAQKHAKHCRASIGIHPHEAAKYSESELQAQLRELAQLASAPEVVAVGECGFDFYHNDKKECHQKQEILLKGQLEIAKAHNLPVSFHVREAFDEFWPVFDEYPHVRGVLHSFTDRPVHAERALKEGLFIGVNGISTFTTHVWQKELFQNIPLEKIVVETDAPFLTPMPKRGTINTPENVIYITKHLATLRGESEEEIVRATTANAVKLFGL